MTRIKIRCFTNLDEYKHCEWPTHLPAVPSVGQNIEAKSERGRGRRLKIVSLTWTREGCGQDEVVLEVELHH